jgi:hypothetical protein
VKINSAGNESDCQSQLVYEKASVFFIYSFGWDSGCYTWKILREKLLAHGHGWTERRLHERQIDPAQGHRIPSYQPSLVTKGTVMERVACMGSAKTVIPTEPNGPESSRAREVKLELSYTLRVFSHGAATCTFKCSLQEGLVPFENIHAILHLVHNIDPGLDGVQLRSHLTEAYLHLPSEISPGVDRALAPKPMGNPKEGFFMCSLHDLYRQLLQEPPAWIRIDGKSIWRDHEVLFTDDPKQDFQSPLLFTVLQVTRETYEKFRHEPTESSTKEVASILCKLTLDNNDLRAGFENMSFDYLSTALPFNHQQKQLANLCLDERLFFTLSTRGAIAITPKLQGLPSCFVVPSLLNLCEILRMRWHISVLVNNLLDQEIDRLAGPPEEALAVNTTRLLETVYTWRILWASFLRDPVPYLFDGGSVMEVADVAERALRLERLRSDACQKFEILDLLVRDLMERRRLEDVWSRMEI